MTRPSRVVAVAGTATEIGKTWVTARLIDGLRTRGLRVKVRKSAQSFEPDDEGPTDAAVLGAASGESPSEVCPSHRWYAAAMAPPMAADVLGLPAPSLDDLLAELRWPDEVVDVGLVETVGGVRSPVALDADSRDLAIALEPDQIVLVAHAGLGTIDSVRLAVDALSQLDVLVFLNRFDAADDLHRRNLAWLADRDGFDLVTDLSELAERVSL